jgi:hypothetical protein
MDTTLLLDYVIAKCEDPDNPPQYNPTGEELIQLFNKYNIEDIEMFATELMTLFQGE